VIDEGMWLLWRCGKIRSIKDLVDPRLEAVQEMRFDGFGVHRKGRVGET
jgi:hypothetical protein